MNVNRLIYPGFWFGKTKKEEALELAKRGVGGFCIYGGTRQNIQELVSELKQASPLKHLFMCADYEDGLGRWIEGESWVLSNMSIGATQNKEIAYQKGLTLAREALELGIDWVFAPVLDLCDEPNNPIVNTRSFGSNPHQVAAMGQALCQGLADGGVLNSIKHFPGHGRTTQDSHLVLPVLNRTLQELEENELFPFQKTLSVADSVMVGHLLLTALDKQNPASLSKAVITDLLKEKMGFQKLIFTDALCMKAIGDEKQAALQALRAGAHILLSAEDSLALSDFLQKQKDLAEIAAESIHLQEQAAQTLTSVKKGLNAQDFNRTYVENCAVWQGEEIKLSPKEKVAYLELGNEENLAAQSFINALEKKNIFLKKAGEKADYLIAASFSNYKAFKGHINLSEKEKDELCSWSNRYPKTIFISFGSPFGTEKIEKLNGRLFLFSPAQEAQVCAAEILTGKQKPKGSWPLGSLEKNTN